MAKLQRNTSSHQQTCLHEDDAEDTVPTDLKKRTNYYNRLLSKKRRDIENSVLQELFGLIPMHEDLLSRQDKISLLRLVIAYFRLKDLYRCDPDRDAVASAMHLMPDIELGSLTSLSREDVTDAEDASQDIEAHLTQFPDPIFTNQDTHSFIDLSHPIHNYANHSNTNYQFQESRTCSNSSQTTNGYVSKRGRQMPFSGKEQNNDVRLNMSAQSPNMNKSKIALSPTDQENPKSEDSIVSYHLEDCLYPETEAGVFSHLHLVRNGLRRNYEKSLAGQNNGVTPSGVPARTPVTNQSPLELVLSENSFSSTSSTSSPPSMQNKEMDSRVTSGMGVLAFAGVENVPSQKSMVRRKNKKFPPLPDEGHIMLEAVSGFLLFLQSDRTILFVSENVSDHLGYHQAQMIGHPVDDFLHPSDLKELTRYMDQALLSHAGDDGGQPSWLTRQTFYLGMSYYLSKDGQKKSRHRGHTMVQWNVKLGMVQEEKGGYQIQYLVSVCCPVRTNSILEIRAEGAMFMSRHDLGFHFIYCDARIIKLMGYEPTDLIGRTAYHFHCPKDVGLCKSCHVKLMKDGASSSGYYRFLSRTGAWVWLITHATLIEDTQKRPQYIVCRNYVVSEREAEEAIIKEKRKYEEMKCLGFNLDTSLPMTWNIQHPANSFNKSQIASTHHSYASSGFEEIFQSHQFEDNMSASFIESPPTPFRSKSGLLSSKEHGVSCKHKQVKFQKSSHQLIASSVFDCDSTQTLGNTQTCVQTMANSAQKELVSDPGIVQISTVVKIPGVHGQSVSSVDIASVPDCLSLTQEKYQPDFFKDVDSEQTISSTTTPRTCLSYVTTGPSLIPSQTTGSQIPFHEQSDPQMMNSLFENCRDHLTCSDSRQTTLNSSMLSISDSVSYGPEEYELNPNDKDVPFLPNINSRHADRMSHDKKMHFSDNPMQFEDPSLNPLKEDDQLQTMIPLLSDDTSLSESTLADTDLDLDNRSNFYTSSFSVDIFPELDLNSEFSFHTSGDLSCGENQVNLVTDNDFKPNDVLLASRTNETLFQPSSECGKDLEQEGHMENAPHLLSSSSDHHQCMNDFVDSDLLQPLHPVSHTYYNYNPAESIQVDINDSNIIPSGGAADSLRSSSGEELMEVECNVFPQEDFVGVKDVHIPKSSIVNSISVTSPVEAAPESTLRNKTLDSLRQSGHRSLLRSLLRKDFTDMDEHSIPSKKSSYEEGQGSESKHEESQPVETMTNMTDSLFHFSPGDSSSLNSPGTQKMTQELPLPKSALNSRNVGCPSPSQSLMFGREKIPSEVESCSSSQSGDHIPEDLVDLAMEYCGFLDSHRAQEIISELSSLEWAEKQRNQPMSLPDEIAKPTSRPLPIPGFSSKIQQEKPNLVHHQLQHNAKRLSRSTMSTSKHKQCQITNNGKISRNSETKSHSSNQNFKMSLLRQAVTTPNVDKLIEQLPLGKTTLGIKNARTGQSQSKDKVNCCQNTVKVNVQSPKGSVQNLYLGCSNQKSTQKSSSTTQNLEPLLYTHSTHNRTVTSSTSSPSSLSPKSPKDTALAASSSSSHVHIGLSLPSRNSAVLQDKQLTSSLSSTKSCLPSKSSSLISSTEPVSVMVMRKEHHRSRRSKNVSTQTDKRPEEIYPDPEPSSTDIIITPSVYVTQHPSSSSHDGPSSSSSVSLSEHDSSIWSMLVRSPSKASSLEIETFPGSLSSSSSPVSIPDSDSQPWSRRASLEPPSSVPSQKQGKPVSNLSFLHGLLTGELSKDNYQLLDQQLLERERSRSSSSCSETD